MAGELARASAGALAGAAVGLMPDSGQVTFDGRDITGQAPHVNAHLGMTRTFQIVQPFAAQTVRENIAVGVHLHIKNRQTALLQAERIAAQVGLHKQIDQPAGEQENAAPRGQPRGSYSGVSGPIEG